MQKNEKMPKFCIRRFVKRMIVFEILGWIAIVTAFYFILRPFLVFPEHFEGQEATGDATFYFFYTTWCGWSKKAWPHWNEMKRFVDSRKVTYGGKEIKLVAIDADKSPEMTNTFHVKGYPSFRLQTPEQIFEFSGAPSVEKFREFLKRTLGYELVE
jgi:thiol-disulfide isomerase/thioredoxin